MNEEVSGKLDDTTAEIPAVPELADILSVISTATQKPTLVDSTSNQSIHRLSQLSTLEKSAIKHNATYLDCGSVKFYIPDGMECFIEWDDHKEPHLVHCIFPELPGECIVSAYAAPKGDNSWPKLLAEIAKQLRSEGIRVEIFSGYWGKELSAQYGDYDINIIGYQGDRWILRSVVFSLSSSPKEKFTQEEFPMLVHMARIIMSNTHIKRGSEPLPAFSPLPLLLPHYVLHQIHEQMESSRELPQLSFEELTTEHYNLVQENKSKNHSQAFPLGGFKQMIEMIKMHKQ